MPLTVELLPDHDDGSLPSLLEWHTLKVTSRGKLDLKRAEDWFISTAHVLCTLFCNYDSYICFKGKKIFDLICEKEQQERAIPIHSSVCVCMCLHSWKSRAESLHLVVPGVSAVIPLKGRHALAPTPEIQRISLAEIPLHLSLKGRPNPCKPTECRGRGQQVRLFKLLIVDCSGVVQVDLLSPVSTPFKFPVRSRHVSTPPSPLCLSGLKPPSPPDPTAKNMHARFSVASISVKCLSVSFPLPLDLPFRFPVSGYAEAAWRKSLISRCPTEKNL